MASTAEYDIIAIGGGLAGAAQAKVMAEDGHRILNWMRTMFYETGPEGAAIRARALPRLAEDPSRGFDIMGVGPDYVTDENARRRFFGED